jgi:hypothetical protein
MARPGTDDHGDEAGDGAERQGVARSGDVGQRADHW